MTDFPWLSAALLLPILGAVVVALLPARDGDLPKKVAFGFSLLTLVNTGAAARTLSVFAYNEWVLGPPREDEHGAG